MMSAWVEAPQTNLVTNFLNLENRECQFFLMVTFKQIFDIPLLNNISISFLNLFISLIKLKNIYWKHPLKGHRCKFKIDKKTYSKS